MAPLILDSLEIRNFRALREVVIARLGRVNLFVGKNNVGKSSVLEALRLYARPGDPRELVALLTERDEFDPRTSNLGSSDPSQPLPVENLFYGRNMFPPNGSPPAISVGPSQSADRVLNITCELEEQEEKLSSSGKEQDLRVSLASPSGATLVIRLGKFVGRVSVSDPDRWSHRLFSRHLARIESQTEAQVIPLVYRGARSISRETLAELWDRVALTPYEDDAYTALRIIAPEIERLVLKPIGGRYKLRVPFVKLKGQDRPVSLRSMGDGIDRLFGIAMGMVNAKDGFLLIDEVENGLHYSIQLQLWRLLFSVARRLNIQVFATTHSSDCIKSFELAARESDEDCVVIRLAQKNDRILVAEFDENELEIAVEGQIEVR